MVRRESSSLQIPVLATTAACVLVIGLAAIGLVFSNPGAVLLAGLATLLAGGAGMVLVVRAARGLSGRRAHAAVAVGAVSIVMVMVVVTAVLGIVLFLVSYGDPKEEDAVSSGPAPDECTAITQQQNELVVDGMTLQQVESVLGRPLVLRDHSDDGSGTAVDVYEWKQFASENGCNQYASYEFRDGQLVFRRWTPAN